MVFHRPGSYGAKLHRIVSNIRPLPFHRHGLPVRTFHLSASTVTPQVTRLAKIFLEKKYNRRMFEQAPLGVSQKRLDLADSMSGYPTVVGEVKVGLGDVRRVPTQLQTYFNLYPKCKIDWYVFIPIQLLQEIIVRKEGVLEVLKSMELCDSTITVCVVDLGRQTTESLEETKWKKSSEQ